MDGHRGGILRNGPVAGPRSQRESFRRLQLKPGSPASLVQCAEAQGLRLCEPSCWGRRQRQELGARADRKEPHQPEVGQKDDHPDPGVRLDQRSEEHTSELQSLMRISYAVFCLKKKKNNITHDNSSLNHNTYKKQKNQ